MSGLAQCQLIRAPSAVGIQLILCTLMFKSSHRPNGRLTFCSMFAGRWCPRLFRHGHDNVFLDLWEHSWLCARSCSKVPIAPMGDSCLPRCLQGGGVVVYSGTVSIVNSQVYSNHPTNVRAHAQNFPSPPWETHVCLLFAGRRCCCLGRHSVNRELPDLLQHSDCAHSSSKAPIARMGKLLTCLP